MAACPKCGDRTLSKDRVTKRKGCKHCGPMPDKLEKTHAG